MSPPVDPHRTLGLRPGATTAEIKAAYRRLAKEFHPDSAGQSALPRFLAIQAAYEALVGAEGGRRETGATAAAPPPWRPDPERTRSNARRRGGYWTGPAGRRAGSAGSSGGTSTDPGGGTERTDPYAWARSRRRPGGPTGDEPADGPATGRRRRRPPEGPPGPGRPGPRGTRRATLGSTSYDDAQEFEPDWAGSDWYGPTSGTYWTVNPKEYADPRKHGPEYQARARRRPAASAAWAGPTVGGSAETSGPADATWSGGSRADAAADAPPAPTRGQPPAEDAQGDEAPAAPGATVTTEARSPIERLAFALTGWPPIGWLLAAGLGEATACNDFAASCPPVVEPATILVQPLVVGLLLLLPRVAVVATGGSIGALAVAIPGAMLFAALGAARDPSGRAALLLTGLIAIGYLAGTVAAARGWPHATPWRDRRRS